MKLTKIHHTAVPKLDTTVMDQIMLNSLRNSQEQLEQYLENTLRTLASPPIKGEITQGKLKHRGIKRVVQPSTGLSWLEQRGTMLGVPFNSTLSFSWSPGTPLVGQSHEQ